eukprot:218955-Ditylum_brightwellii.AAC.1
MNMKLQVQANSNKKGFLELKRELNKSRFMHRSEMSKMQEVMKAKEALHEAQLDEMRVELDSAKYKIDQYEAELGGMGFGIGGEIGGGEQGEVGEDAYEEGEEKLPEGEETED